MGFDWRVLLVAVGSGLNLSTYGLGVWGESVIVSGGAFAGARMADPSSYVLLSTAGLLAALAVRVAIAFMAGGSNRHYLATGLGPMMLSSVLFLSGMWNGSPELMMVAAFAAGWAFSCQQMFWMSSLAEGGVPARQVFPLQLVVAALVNLVFLFRLEDQGLILGLCLAVSTALSVVAVAGKADASFCGKVKAEALEGRSVAALRPFVAILFCVAVLQTIAPTLNYLGFMGALDPGRQQLVLVCAKACAAVAVFAILRWSHARYYSVQVFKFVTPVLVLLLFAVPFAGSAYTFCVLAVGSCLHFVVMSSLFCVDALALARRCHLVFEGFYGLGYLLLMILCAALMHVMPRLLNTSSSAELLLLFGVFFCVYLLSIAFVAIRRRTVLDGGAPALSLENEGASEGVAEEASEGAAEGRPMFLSGEGRLALVRERNGLSEREAEIVALMMRGKNVPAIAEELVVSQNTVRTHVKRIYRACGVHSRQELISYCEAVSADD